MHTIPWITTMSRRPRQSSSNGRWNALMDMNHGAAVLSYLTEPVHRLPLGAVSPDEVEPVRKAARTFAWTTVSPESKDKYHGFMDTWKVQSMHVPTEVKIQAYRSMKEYTMYWEEHTADLLALDGMDTVLALFESLHGTRQMELFLVRDKVVELLMKLVVLEPATRWFSETHARHLLTEVYLLVCFRPSTSPSSLNNMVRWCLPTLDALESLHPTTNQFPHNQLASDQKLRLLSAVLQPLRFQPIVDTLHRPVCEWLLNTLKQTDFLNAVRVDLMRLLAEIIETMVVCQTRPDLLVSLLRSAHCLFEVSVGTNEQLICTTFLMKVACSLIDMDHLTMRQRKQTMQAIVTLCTFTPPDVLHDVPDLRFRLLKERVDHEALVEKAFSAIASTTLLVLPLTDDLIDFFHDSDTDDEDDDS